ncbi:hypothetical protein [Salinigranum halophilum]|jgi:hypothetical protein|nr:hypothetical protein [Salinigranum halophilum]
MPELTISDELYTQLETETTDGDVEGTLWRMVAMYRRTHSPQADHE